MGCSGQSCQVKAQKTGSFECQFEVGYLSQAGEGTLELELWGRSRVLCCGNFPG
jgi:hypothetical protein